MNFQLLDQHCVNSKIKGISILAILVVTSTAKGDEASALPLRTTSASPASHAAGDAPSNASSAEGAGGGAGTPARQPVVHSTISYLSGSELTRTQAHKSSFVLPPHFHLDSRWGPYFEEGPEPHNVTARVGSTVTLDCRIGLLHDRTVTWLHHRNESIHLLTVGRNAYSSDERINLSFRYPNNWRLEILYVTRQDQGLYECQVATHPPKVKRLFLKVVAPELTVVDDLGRHVTERYYKVGSTLELTCVATQTDISGETMNIEEHRMSWRHGDRILKQGISFNYSLSLNAVISSVTISPVAKSHSGNYTCSIDGITSASVSVHILNDEIPAAVYHGNSASHRKEENHLFLSLTVPVLLYHVILDLAR